MVCVTELESATYGYSFLLELLYAIFFGVIALVINAVGKFSVLRKCYLYYNILKMFLIISKLDKQSRIKKILKWFFLTTYKIYLKKTHN